jgi:hypothetical protein
LIQAGAGTGHRNILAGDRVHPPGHAGLSTNGAIRRGDGTSPQSRTARLRSCDKRQQTNPRSVKNIHTSSIIEVCHRPGHRNLPVIRQLPSGSRRLTTPADPARAASPPKSSDAVRVLEYRIARTTPAPTLSRTLSRTMRAPSETNHRISTGHAPAVHRPSIAKKPREYCSSGHSGADPAESGRPTCPPRSPSFYGDEAWPNTASSSAVLSPRRWI